MIKSFSHILKISPYVGGDITPPGMTRRIVLASNENPYGASPSVQRALEQCIQNVAHYPSGSASKLTHALSNHYGVSFDHIICGSGSEEILHLIARAYVGQGDDVIIPKYGFLVYSIATHAVGGNLIKVDQPGLKHNIQGLIDAVTPQTKVVFLDNPANPLGCYSSKTDLIYLRDNLPDHVLLVLDEAYAEFMDESDYASGLDIFKDDPRVITLRTFSKIYGLANLRVGFGYGVPSLLDPLHRIRAPFNVNGFAQEAAVASLLDQEWVKFCKNNNAYSRDFTHKELEKLGYYVHPGYGNFLLIDCKDEQTAQNIYEHLGKNGIMVRPVKAYALPHCLRISIGKQSDMEEFIDLLKKYNI